MNSNAQIPTPARPELQEAIIQVITFADGSRLTVKVETPAGSKLDRATAAYYAHILSGLDRIEGEGQKQ